MRFLTWRLKLLNEMVVAESSATEVRDFKKSLAAERRTQTIEKSGKRPVGESM